MDFLSSILRFPVQHLPFVLLVLVISFTVHEFAHAYSASKFGDPTAKMLGRVTLNPVPHIDIFGMLMLLILGFGWAKPVPVNRDNFSKPRLMGIIVSLVGPLSNLVIGFIAAMIYFSLDYYHIIDLTSQDKLNQAIYIFLNYLISINITLFFFNLLPLPPLDGYRIVEDLVPRNFRSYLQEYEKWSVLIFLLLVFIDPLRRITLDPLFSLMTPIVDGFRNIFLAIVGG
ncbi:site-2 protease family protein [Paenibacillus sp. CAA11]|uniref:site-2 protease family protein n=1 Tax=Paenibacillus sp. CAA11 TaxID=1532905 RepID=UPI000D3C8DA2|nr:site-2 protease family protein [Paenibacillus sp. CAA11]AWB45421.1 site-2 protease family protein [Paenibacillus sp. CAA11]